MYIYIYIYGSHRLCRDGCASVSRIRLSLITYGGSRARDLITLTTGNKKRADAATSRNSRAITAGSAREREEGGGGV